MLLHLSIMWLILSITRHDKQVKTSYIISGFIWALSGIINMFILWFINT